MKAVNLIPGDARRNSGVKVSGGIGPGYAVIGLLGVAVLLVSVYVLTSNTISDRQSKLADAADPGHPGAGAGQPADQFRVVPKAHSGAGRNRSPDRLQPVRLARRSRRPL